MKKTLYLFAALLAVTLLFVSQDAQTSNAGTCCQKFQLVSVSTPLSGCVISLSPCTTICQCSTTNDTCTICNLDIGFNYTATVNCDGGRTADTTFTACTGSTISIIVP